MAKARKERPTNEAVLAMLMTTPEQWVCEGLGITDAALAEMLGAEGFRGSLGELVERREQEALRLVATAKALAAGKLVAAFDNGGTGDAKLALEVLKGAEMLAEKGEGPESGWQGVMQRLREVAESGGVE
jgi:hypothetical protein